jgi:hypothetical protein
MWKSGSVIVQERFGEAQWKSELGNDSGEHIPARSIPVTIEHDHGLNVLLVVYRAKKL